MIFFENISAVSKLLSAVNFCRSEIIVVLLAVAYFIFIMNQQVLELTKVE
jgi:hypothetical protein